MFIKIFSYIIYSGNIISCSKGELTEYWNDERIPLSIPLIVFLICLRVGQMRSRSRHSAVVGALNRIYIAYNLKIKLIIWLNSDAQGVVV